MAWSPGSGCLTSPASLAIGCELSSPKRRRRQQRGLVSGPFTPRLLQPPLQPRGGGSLPAASWWPQVRDAVRLKVPGCWVVGRERVGQPRRPAQAPLAIASAPTLPRPGLAPRLCSAVQQFAAASRARPGALLCAAGLPGSGPREEPRAGVGEARGKVRSPNFANENPDPSISSPLRKKQDTAECGAQGEGEKGAFAGMCFS